MIKSYPFSVLIFIYFISLVPIPIGVGNSSLFDLFLPLFIIYFTFKYFHSKSVFPLIIVYLVSSLFLTLKVLDSTNTIILLGWVSRFALFFSPLFILHLSNKISSSKYSQYLFRSFWGYFSITLMFLILSTYSFLHYIGILLPRFWGLGFPFYSNGLDPHVFGPTLSLIVVFNVTLLMSKCVRFRPYQSQILLFSSILLLVFSIISASRGVFAIYVASIVFTVLHILLKLSKNSRMRRKILSSSIALSISSFMIYVIYGLFVVRDTAITPTSNSYFFRVLSKISRLDSLGSIILDPSADSSRGKKVIDMITLISNPNNWLVGVSDFKSVYDSGFLLFYQNFGLFIVIFFYIIYLLTVFKFQFKFPLASCFVFCALVHFSVASETLLIPRFNLVLIYLIYSSIYMQSRPSPKHFYFDIKTSLSTA